MTVEARAEERSFVSDRSPDTDINVRTPTLSRRTRILFLHFQDRLIQTRQLPVHFRGNGTLLLPNQRFMSMSAQKQIFPLAQEAAPELIALRRHIHQHPELGLDLPETAGLVAQALAAEGIPFKEGVGQSGIVACIEGGKPGPCLLLRADMDALPITEQTGLEYASTIEGRMHACGHDLHTAALVGVAKVLWALRDSLHGTFKLAFQPGEEGLKGARAMIADGLLQNPTPDFGLGFHNWPMLDAGSVGFHPVASFAGSQNFTITLHGLSGHGAHPHKAIDTIVAAASLVMQLQTIVSREVAPSKPAVISIGRIEGGSAPNVIAETVSLSGTIRALEPEIFTQVRKIMERQMQGLQEGMRVSHKTSFSDILPPLINNPDVLHTTIGAARAVLGNDNVVELPETSMGAEDFAFITSQLPSAHLRIGSRTPGGETRMIHRSDYLPDEGFIVSAVRVLAEAAVELTGGNKP